MKGFILFILFILLIYVRVNVESLYYFTNFVFSGIVTPSHLIFIFDLLIVIFFLFCIYKYTEPVMKKAELDYEEFKKKEELKGQISALDISKKIPIETLELQDYITDYLSLKNEHFTITDRIFVAEKRTMFIKSDVRLEFLLDNIHQKIFLFDSHSNPNNFSEIIKPEQIINFEFIEVESQSHGTVWIERLSVKIIIKDLEKKQSDRVLGTELLLNFIPPGSNSKVTRANPIYFSLKENADKVIFFLRSIGVSENSNLINQANNRITNCPGCNANIVGLNSDVCPYCRNSIPN